jgi:Ca2+-binding EF-hand superfamily protein
MRGGFDPAMMIQRLDANGNGMLDPDETQGRARMMMENFTRDADIDFDKPVPVNKVVELFNRMREERERSGGGFRGGGPPRGDSGRGDSGRGDSSSRRDDGRGRDSRGSSSSSSSNMEPLVPGFGEPDMFDPVPGFGQMGDALAVRVTDDDRREAERTMERNDRNRDGVLDGDEIRSGRWSNDPLQTDRNKDGKLSISELALRYAVRRAERDGSSSSSSGARSSSRSSGPSSSRGSSGEDPRLAGLLQSVYQRYDRNRNGVFEKDEWSSFRTDPSSADKNRDGKITRDEISVYLQERYLGGSRGDSRDGGRDGRSSWYGRRDEGGDNQSGRSDSPSGSGSADRQSYRIPTATERLPEGLPDWYARSDANGDGQVMMSEYAASWSQMVANDFRQFDLNNDGVITPNECLEAVDAGAVQGVAPSSPTMASSQPSSSYRSRRRDFSRREEPREEKPSTPVSTTSAAPTTDGSAAAPAPTAVASGSADPRYVKYAVGLIKRYDQNSDGVLTKEEWTKMSNDYSAADRDGDGRITPTELALEMAKK